MKGGLYSIMDDNEMVSIKSQLMKFGTVNKNAIAVETVLAPVFTLEHIGLPIINGEVMNLGVTGSMEDDEVKHKVAIIKELRNVTGARMIDCKKALTEADYDIDAAIEILKNNPRRRYYT